MQYYRDEIMFSSREDRVMLVVSIIFGMFGLFLLYGGFMGVTIGIIIGIIIITVALLMFFKTYSDAKKRQTNALQKREYFMKYGVCSCGRIVGAGGGVIKDEYMEYYDGSPYWHVTKTNNYNVEVEYTDVTTGEIKRTSVGGMQNKMTSYIGHNVQVYTAMWMGYQSMYINIL